MAIKRMDEVLAAIAAGKSNTEIRDQIDGRIGDKAINQLRKHPANADVPWPEDALRYEAEQAEQAARAETPEGARSATKGEQTEGLPTCTTAPQNARAVAEEEQAGAEAAAPAEEEQVPFAPEAEETAPEETAPEEPVPEETVPAETDEDEGPQLPECVTAMLEETDPPMSVAEAIRELALYALTDDPDHLIAAALAVKTRMHKLNRRIKR